MAGVGGGQGINAKGDRVSSFLVLNVVFFFFLSVENVVMKCSKIRFW